MRRASVTSIRAVARMSVAEKPAKRSKLPGSTRQAPAAGS